MSDFLTACRYRLEWLVALSVRMVVRVVPMSVVRAAGLPQPVVHP